MSDQMVLSESSTTGRLKSKNILAFKMCLTLIILYFLIISLDSKQLFTSFSHSNFWIITAAAVMGFLNIYIQFYKWKVICSKTLGESNNQRIWKSLLVGFAGAVITPFRLGEYAGRSLGLNNKDITRITIGTLIDHFFSFVTILIAGLTAAMFFLKWINYISTEILLLLLLVEVFIIISIRWLIQKGSLLKFKAVEYLSNVTFLKKEMLKAEAFNGIDINTRYRLLSFSLLSFLFYTVQYSLLVCALSGQWALHLYFVAGILTIFTKSVIPAVTFGDLGIREGASVFFISQIGLPGAFGFNAALLLFFMNIAIPSLIGGILLSARK